MMLEGRVRGSYQVKQMLVFPDLICFVGKV